jgi:flagellar assembly factor FliW
MAFSWYQASSFYLQNSAPESFSSELNATHTNEFDITDAHTVPYYVILSKKNWNVSTNFLKPIILNSMKFRATGSQVNTCGLTGRNDKASEHNFAISRCNRVTNGTTGKAKVLCIVILNC